MGRLGEDSPALGLRCEKPSRHVSSHETVRDSPQRVTRRDLGAPSFVDETAGSRIQRCTRGHAIGSQSLEAKAIHRLEWQRALETLLRGGVEVSSRLEHPLAVELGAIALEAERGLPGGPTAPGPQLVPARLTQGSRPSAFELAAGKLNPFLFNNLRWCPSNHAPV